MERTLIVEHLRKRRKFVTLTFVLLLVAAAENYYLNCPQGLWCYITLLYIFLAAAVAFVLFWYRK